jgi:ribose 5-phosphate isomerase A
LRVAFVTDESVGNERVDDFLGLELRACKLVGDRVAQRCSPGEVTDRGSPRETRSKRRNEFSQIDVLDRQAHAIICAPRSVGRQGPTGRARSAARFIGAHFMVSVAVLDPMADAKRSAAQAALRELPPTGIVGLGSGSTARLFVEELAHEVRRGLRIVAVPSSEATRALAARLGIPLLEDAGPWDIDVNVDGADEVSAELDLIKGGGGAHAREKIVNFASRRNVIVVDASKMSARLGEKHPVPVEVLPFAHGMTRAHIARFGTPTLRMRAGTPVHTDAGNLLYDLSVPPIDDPAALDGALRAIPGVVETGLFVARTDVVLVADAQGGVRRFVRNGTGTA